MMLLSGQNIGCPVPNTRVRNMFVRGLWNEFAYEHLAARRSGADNVRFVKPDTVPNEIAAGHLLSSATCKVPVYWHLTLSAREVITQRTSENAVFVDNTLP